MTTMTSPAAQSMAEGIEIAEAVVELLRSGRNEQHYFDALTMTYTAEALIAAISRLNKIADRLRDYAAASQPSALS